MLYFICLFFPAVISVCIYDKLSGGHLSRRNCVYLYVISNVTINIICAVFKKLFFKTADLNLVTGLGDYTPSTMLNYMLVAVPAAIIIGCIVVLLDKKDVKVTKE